MLSRRDFILGIEEGSGKREEGGAFLVNSLCLGWVGLGWVNLLFIRFWGFGVWGFS